MLWLNRKRTLLMVLAGSLIVLAVLAWMLAWPLLQRGLLIAATIVAGVPVAARAWSALRLRIFSIELLVTIAVIGALIIREYTESAVVTFLFLFGDFLEARTLAKTRESLRTLLDLAPEEAERITASGSEVVPVEAVEVGDRLILRTGSKVPVDGRVLSGEAWLVEAAITGESLPAGKAVGDRLFSGTIVDSGYLEMVAERVGEDTAFARMIELVEEAQDAKTKTEQFLDRFARFYTPLIVVLAVVVYAITRNLHLAITFLVVACPGALVIGAPVSTVAGIGNGAHHGVLIKGGDVIERLATADTLVFDKTGTLTAGKPSLSEIKLFEPAAWTADEILTLAASAEQFSEHPLGRTIVAAAQEKNLTLIPSDATPEIIKGQGLVTQVKDWRIALGNRRLMQDRDVRVTAEMAAVWDQMEAAGETVVGMAMDQELVALFAIDDAIRPDAAASIAHLRRIGIKQMVLLTGDNAHSARRVATGLGLDAYRGGLLPEDKVTEIRKLQAAGAKVAMAGDGVNDAPAMATADVGLAMGGGTDVAMETADVVLMSDRLSQLTHAYALTRATARNIRQNTAFAVAVVLLLLLGVLLSKVHLASGMFIHEGSILLVILNAMRLIRFSAVQ